MPCYTFKADKPLINPPQTNSAMIQTKYLKWFKVGELIPANGVYIKSEKRKENITYDEHGHEECDLVEHFLYEIFN